MPRRLPPMPDSPRDGPPPAINLCPRCSAEGVITTGCQKPSLHQPVHGRFWDRLLSGTDDADGVVSALRTPRAALQPLDAAPGTNRVGGRCPDVDDSGDDSETDAHSLPEAEPLPLHHRRGNVLPPLPPQVEMAVLRKLYMAGMTVSPRSRQIKPLPQLGDRHDNDDDDAPEAEWPEVDEEQEEDLPPTVYDPSLLDESLVRELSLDDLLRPEVQRPARLRLDPISGVKSLRPAQGVFCRRHSLVPAPALTETAEEE